MAATTTTTRKPRRKAEAAATPKPKKPAPANRVKKPATSTKTPKSEPTAPKSPSKIDQVVALLRREEGATTKALMEATGWQAHSVRGIIAGAIKKKLGLTVASTKADGERTYRIQSGEPA